MTMQEFIDVTDDIEKFYGKAINSFERNIWFEEIGKLKVEKYKKIVKHCFRTEKYMPKLADILRIKKELPNERVEWIPVDCRRCNSTGMISYHKFNQLNEMYYTYVCRCNCENGQRLSKNIPQIDEINILDEGVINK